jgi:lipopolysaccharide transport system permease protein
MNHDIPHGIPLASHVTVLAAPPVSGFWGRAQLAISDVRDAAAMWRLCWTLSWLDIKLRYRGSVLGPFWLTLSTAIMVGSMGFLYAALFKMDLHEYLPFLALSIVLWNFLSGIVAEGCTSFTASDSMIRSVRMPFTLYGARVVVRNVVILAHNVAVIVVVDLLLSLAPGSTALLAIPAFALWLVVGVALSVVLGALCARFRDIPPIIGSVMQMAFFVSGVIWQPSQLGNKEYLLLFNPFFTLLEIVRGPLLGQVPGVWVYVSAGLSALAICIVSGLLFARTRGRIAFWV